MLFNLKDFREGIRPAAPDARSDISVFHSIQNENVSKSVMHMNIGANTLNFWITTQSYGIHYDHFYKL